jgi:class 3 adenylate cyclase
MSTRDSLLELLVRAASGDLLPPRRRTERALVAALEAEGLVMLRGDAYRATGAGLRALDDRGRAPAVSGAVAVLFTDFVGSTRLVEALGDRAAHRALRHHFDLLRAAIREHAGHEVKSLGDGLMVVFTGAPDAVACAKAMQTAIAQETDGLGLRVGIHAGEPVRDGNDYFGTPVIVARRLCDSAHGGQTLVSELVQQLAGECEFESLENITLHGLRDPVRASALAGRRPRSASPVAVAVAAA